MTAGLETLLSFDWGSIVTIVGWIGTVGGVTVAVIKTLKEKGLAAAVQKFQEEIVAKGKEIAAIKNIFSSDVPMDDEQREVATQKDIQKAWRMPARYFDDMYTALAEARKLEIREADLRAAVDEAEAALEPEYGIVMLTPNGDIDMKATHVFVTYGVPMYYSNYDGLMEQLRLTNSPLTVNVTEDWHLSDEEKDSIFADIWNKAEYVVYLTNEIAKYEAAETERYALQCGSQWWIIERGKVVQRGAGGDTNDRIAEEAANDVEEDK